MVARSKWVLCPALAAGVVCGAWAAVYAAPASMSTQMHVERINIGVFTKKGGLGGRAQLWLGAIVTIVDQNNETVQSASVSGSFTHHNGTVYQAGATTDRYGRAFLTVKPAGGDDCGENVHSFAVTSVTKSGATYKPESNCITSFAGNCSSCGGCGC